MTSNSPGSVQIDRDDVERTIIAIVSRHRGYPEDRIKPDTDLVGDLGIAGDDADRDNESVFSEFFSDQIGGPVR